MTVEDFDGNENPVEKKEGSGVLSEAVLETISMLQKKIEELEKGNRKDQPDSTDSKLLRELISQLKNGTNEGSYDFRERYISEHEIDPDDDLPKEQWATFVAHTVGFTIVDDKKNGRAVRVPYSPIVFQYDSTRRVQNGKETEITNLSRYTCRSKKELEFLRSHSNYNIFFFENMKGAVVDANKSMKLISIHSSLKSQGIHELTPYVRKYGLDMDTPLDMLRVQIANKYVDEQIEHEKSTNELRVNESFLERELIRK